MKMTDKEIDAAREDVTRIWSSYFPTDNPWTIAATKALDALCAAARPQENLVGKRVRVKASLGDIGFGNLMTISCGPLWLGESPKRAITLTRDDFELLEGDDAE